MEPFTLPELRAAWQAICSVCIRAGLAYDAAVQAEHTVIESGVKVGHPAYLAVTRATDAAWAAFAAAVQARNEAFAAWERAGT